MINATYENISSYYNILKTIFPIYKTADGGGSKTMFHNKPAIATAINVLSTIIYNLKLKKHRMGANDDLDFYDLGADGGELHEKSPSSSPSPFTQGDDDGSVKVVDSSSDEFFNINNIIKLLLANKTVKPVSTLEPMYNILNKRDLLSTKIFNILDGTDFVGYDEIIIEFDDKPIKMPVPIERSETMEPVLNDGPELVSQSDKSTIHKSLIEFMVYHKSSTKSEFIHYQYLLFYLKLISNLQFFVGDNFTTYFYNYINKQSILLNKMIIRFKSDESFKHINFILRLILDIGNTCLLYIYCQISLGNILHTPIPIPEDGDYTQEQEILISNIKVKKATQKIFVDVTEDEERKDEERDERDDEIGDVVHTIQFEYSSIFINMLWKQLQLIYLSNHPINENNNKLINIILISSIYELYYKAYIINKHSIIDEYMIIYNFNTVSKELVQQNIHIYDLLVNRINSDGTELLYNSYSNVIPDYKLQLNYAFSVIIELTDNIYIRNINATNQAVIDAAAVDAAAVDAAAVDAADPHPIPEYNYDDIEKDDLIINYNKGLADFETNWYYGFVTLYTLFGGPLMNLLFVDKITLTIARLLESAQISWFINKGDDVNHTYKLNYNLSSYDQNFYNTIDPDNDNNKEYYYLFLSIYSIFKANKLLIDREPIKTKHNSDITLSGHFKTMLKTIVNNDDGKGRIYRINKASKSIFITSISAFITYYIKHISNLICIVDQHSATLYILNIYFTIYNNTSDYFYVIPLIKAPNWSMSHAKEFIKYDNIILIEINFTDAIYPAMYDPIKDPEFTLSFSFKTYAKFIIAYLFKCDILKYIINDDTSKLLFTVWNHRNIYSNELNLLDLSKITKNDTLIPVINEYAGIIMTRLFTKSFIDERIIIRKYLSTHYTYTLGPESGEIIDIYLQRKYADYYGIVQKTSKYLPDVVPYKPTIFNNFTELLTQYLNYLINVASNKVIIPDIIIELKHQNINFIDIFIETLCDDATPILRNYIETLSKINFDSLQTYNTLIKLKSNEKSPIVPETIITDQTQYSIDVNDKLKIEYGKSKFTLNKIGFKFMRQLTKGAVLILNIEKMLPKMDVLLKTIDMTQFIDRSDISNNDHIQKAVELAKSDKEKYNNVVKPIKDNIENLSAVLTNFINGTFKANVELEIAKLESEKKLLDANIEPLGVASSFAEVTLKKKIMEKIALNATKKEAIDKYNVAEEFARLNAASTDADFDEAIKLHGDLVNKTRAVTDIDALIAPLQKTYNDAVIAFNKNAASIKACNDKLAEIKATITDVAVTEYITQLKAKIDVLNAQLIELRKQYILTLQTHNIDDLINITEDNIDTLDADLEKNKDKLDIIKANIAKLKEINDKKLVDLNNDDIDDDDDIVDDPLQQLGGTPTTYLSNSFSLNDRIVIPFNYKNQIRIDITPEIDSADIIINENIIYINTTFHMFIINYKDKNILKIYDHKHDKYYVIYNNSYYYDFDKSTKIKHNEPWQTGVNLDPDQDENYRLNIKIIENKDSGETTIIFTDAINSVKYFIIIATSSCTMTIVFDEHTRNNITIKLEDTKMALKLYAAGVDPSGDSNASDILNVNFAKIAYDYNDITINELINFNSDFNIIIPSRNIKILQNYKVSNYRTIQLGGDGNIEMQTHFTKLIKTYYDTYDTHITNTIFKELYKIRRHKLEELITHPKHRVKYNKLMHETFLIDARICATIYNLRIFIINDKNASDILIITPYPILDKDCEKLPILDLFDIYIVKTKSGYTYGLNESYIREMMCPEINDDFNKRDRDLLNIIIKKLTGVVLPYSAEIIAWNKNLYYTLGIYTKFGHFNYNYNYPHKKYISECYDYYKRIVKLLKITYIIMETPESLETFYNFVVLRLSMAYMDYTFYTLAEVKFCFIKTIMLLNSHGTFIKNLFKLSIFELLCMDAKLNKITPQLHTIKHNLMLKSSEMKNGHYVKDYDETDEVIDITEKNYSLLPVLNNYLGDIIIDIDGDYRSCIYQYFDSDFGHTQLNNSARLVNYILYDEFKSEIKMTINLLQFKIQLAVELTMQKIIPVNFNLYPFNIIKTYYDNNIFTRYDYSIPTDLKHAHILADYYQVSCVVKKGGIIFIDNNFIRDYFNILTLIYASYEKYDTSEIYTYVAYNYINLYHI